MKTVLLLVFLLYCVTLTIILAVDSIHRLGQQPVSSLDVIGAIAIVGAGIVGVFIFLAACAGKITYVA